MKNSMKVVLGMVLAGAVTAAAAQAVPADRAIKFRQGVLTAMGWNMNIMGAMVKGDRPYNKDEFLLRATNLEHLAPMAWEGFVPGSEANSKAKPEIWKDAAKFKQHQDALVAASAKLVAAAKTGTLDAVKGPFGDVGKTCGSCHDDFRTK